MGAIVKKGLPPDLAIDDFRATVLIKAREGLFYVDSAIAGPEVSELPHRTLPYVCGFKIGSKASTCLDDKLDLKVQGCTEERMIGVAIMVIGISDGWTSVQDRPLINVAKAKTENRKRQKKSATCRIRTCAGETHQLSRLTP